jgi:tripartite-type tricarboxylate transporter receptor subunit TctC
MTGRLCAVGLAALLAAAATASASAQTQNWPTKPVRLIIGMASGGPTDTLARTVAENLGQVLGQPTVVENKPGAAGNLAAETVVNSPPDGHTLFLSGMGPFTVNSVLFASLPFDPERDLSPITVVARTPMVLSVNPALPVKTFAEFVAYAKANSGKVSHATPGVGTAPHLTVELFRNLAGFDSTNAVYRSGPLMVNAVMQGEVQWTMDSPLTTIPQHHAGKIRSLAITSEKRSPELPDVPTMAELGFPQVTVYAWFAMAAPAGTPKDIVDRLSAETGRALKDEKVRERLSKLGFEPAPMTPIETAKWFATERERWTPVIKANNIRAY